MYGIFRIVGDEDEAVILDKDAVKLVPELTALSNKELLYVIMVYDWFDSPFRRMPLDMRKTIARRKLWKGTAEKNYNPEKKEYIQKAIEGYKSICYNATNSTAEAIRSKLAFLNHKLVIEKEMSMKESKDVIDQLSFFSDRLYSLEQEIKAADINQAEIKGNLKLSKIELWQRRQQAYAKVNKYISE